MTNTTINVPPPGPSGSGVNCTCSEKILAQAKLYSWPTYHDPPYTEYKPEYLAAVKEAQSRGWYVGGGQYPGIDCGGFVTLVMRFSGADPNYNSYQSNTLSQKKYLDEHPELYQKIGIKYSTDGLQPGDIAINSSHTYIYVGDKGFKDYNALSASIGPPWRSPMASNAYFSNDSGPFIWYRLKCPGL
jgi:cell wall-associated NlpC family hydrolase